MGQASFDLDIIRASAAGKAGPPPAGVGALLGFDGRAAAAFGAAVVYSGETL